MLVDDPIVDSDRSIKDGYEPLIVTRLSAFLFCHYMNEMLVGRLPVMPAFLEVS